MKEIDDQYSEYFPMNETVKGVKHKSKLGFSISSALPFCTAALIATMLITNVPQKAPFVLPEYPGSFSIPEAPVVSEQIPKPPPSSPTPPQTPQPTPTQAPTPTPTPTPTPPPAPTPTPTQITDVPYDYSGLDIGPLPAPPPATKTAPEIAEPTFVFHTGQLASEVSFSVTMNDLQGGSATATLYCKKNGVFVPCSNPAAQAVYPGSGNVWSGTLYGGGDSDSEGLQTTLKLVIEYTYPDGETGRYESAEQTGFTGHIIVFPGVSYSYDPASRTYTADYVIDSLLKDGISTYTEAVYFAPTEQDLKNHTLITNLNPSDYTVTVLQHDEADGAHVTFRYQFAADPTSGYYHFAEHINYSGSYGTAEDWRISRPHLP